MTRKSNGLTNWVGELQTYVRRSLDATMDRTGANLAAFRPWLERTTGCDTSEAGFRDACAEALAWTIVYATHESDDGIAATLKRSASYSPFVAELLSVLRAEQDTGSLAGYLRQTPFDSSSDPLLFYESFLAASDPSRRSERGVFYTPRVIARHIVERVDAALRERFGLADGLADTTTWSEMQRRWPTLQIPQGTSGDEPFVRILDPAAGSGVFLVEVVERIHRTMRERWRAEQRSEDEIAARWNEYVPRHLLSRVFAVELMVTPCVISQIAIARKLAETGYDFKSEEQFRFSVADTLLDPAIVADLAVNDLTTVLCDTLSRVAFTVVLGNPPFRGISSNPSNWVGKLLRGTGPSDLPVVSYYEVDGEPLGERKLWLQDDYVKFMRYAQWQIERAGVGVLGFVTNHGYLDNATFRGMRHALLETFQQIDVFDLHGNRKKNKVTPDGGSDEGMFEIEQGVAIGIFSRIGSQATTCVTHREVWGTRKAKSEAIAEDDRVPRTQIIPRSPHYLFVPTNKKSHPEYEAGLALNDAMPVNSTAVVTARDSFVVAFDEASLADRLRVFCDESVSDAEIRSRFFTNGRSTKYPPGDTRGWKLADARRRMMQETDWTNLFRPCLYRPFDRRTIVWADWMIDWSRQDVMRHMLARPNLALVARRQMPPNGPCSYFWITDTIAIDGLIRSDNRGSESIFPLWLDSDSATRTVNLSPQLVAAIESRLGLAWDASGESSVDNVFGPIDVLHYIYALFNTPTYRLRYRESLRRDFPRIVLPHHRQVWNAFRGVGERLVKLHLLESETTEEPSVGSQDYVALGGGYPRFSADEIWLGKQGPVVPASERVWNFQVGAHQVCRKWLRDRKAFSPRTLQCYHQIVATVTATLELSDKLDAIVADAGGWEAAFVA